MADVASINLPELHPSTRAHNTSRIDQYVASFQLYPLYANVASHAWRRAAIHRNGLNLNRNVPWRNIHITCPGCSHLSILANSQSRRSMENTPFSMPCTLPTEPVKSLTLILCDLKKQPLGSR
jgi:hypothetical protein